MTVLVGPAYLQSSGSPLSHDPLIPWGFSYSPAKLRRGPTLVPSGALPWPVSEAPAAIPRLPGARERRAAQRRDQYTRKRGRFSDAAAFAYFRDWPLSMRITVSWDVCLRHGDHDTGHVLLLPDKDRNERLRTALWRRLEAREQVFACMWSRDTGDQHGDHTHLALHWPLPLEQLAWLLARITGSRPTSDPLPRDVVAQSECGGWQIKRNIARDDIRSAISWTGYLLDQGPRHLVVPKLQGKLLGVSRAIDAKAVAAQRGALEAWKQRVGWTEKEQAYNATQSR